MQNKNFFIAIILSVSFLFFWSMFIMPKYAPKPPVPSPAVQSTTASGTASAAISSAHPESGRAPVPAEAILRDTQNEIVFASQGGGVKHWRLKIKEQEVDLVLNPETQPLPLSTFPDVNFSINQKTNQIALQGTLPNGIQVTKTLTLDPHGHLHEWVLVLRNPTAQTVELKNFQWGWGPGLGTVPSEKKENSALTRVISKEGSKVHPHKKPGEYSFGEWAAIDNRYFLVAFLPGLNAQPKLTVEGTKEHSQIHVAQDLSLPPRSTQEIRYKLYVGPKGYTQLSEYKKGLEAAVDFGKFSVLGKLVLRSVYWLQRQTENYGWAIILLTVILQILMLPLTMKSFKATMAMKELQPQIAALQAAYKGDPKRLNLEMMNLYKKSGTNPFGGCLPMLLQLPIFWALFTTLRNAYELRGAPWIGWIKDLSVADPYHVLPVIMGAGMFLQQRLSGAVTDPMQRQMMYMMPVMFTVMFFNFPAGLVLYWLTQSLIGMAIQWTMLRSHHRKNTKFELVK